MVAKKWQKTNAWLMQKAQANRHNVPWIVTMGHRPMYCSDDDSDDCTLYESVVRNHLIIFSKSFSEIVAHAGTVTQGPGGLN
jgi:hypothetical protein